MRTVEQWFGEYGESHSHPRNELLHIICVPPIVMTVIGFLRDNGFTIYTGEERVHLLPADRSDVSEGGAEGDGAVSGAT